MQQRHLFSAFVLGILTLTACSQATTDQPSRAGTEQATEQTSVNLTPQAFKQAVDKQEALLVDVRTPAEYASGHLAGSINVDWTSSGYEAEFAKLPKDKPLLLYCRSGGRSGQALEYLQAKGYQVQHMEGGIGAWMNAGLPVTK
jgi:rhodanese-related sulfurtransferase